MIFVTVGGQMPFDRLISVVDRWAAETGRQDVFAQIGSSDLKPSNIETAPFLSPEDFRKKVDDAKVIVSHAGMGSILTALELGKPILVMPRRAKFRETRNDHQVATADRFRRQGLVSVADDENDLLECLRTVDELRGGTTIENRASGRLLEAIREFVDA